MTRPPTPAQTTPWLLRDGLAPAAALSGAIATISVVVAPTTTDMMIGVGVAATSMAAAVIHWAVTR